MRGDGGGPERVGDLVKRFLTRKGVRSQVRRMEVLERWSEVVGPGIADVTRARSLSGSTLFVEVRSSPWLMELDMMKEDILARLNRDRDENVRIEKLVFVLAEDGRAGTPSREG